MKKKCSNESYHGFHDLEDMLEDIEAKVKAYGSKGKYFSEEFKKKLIQIPARKYSK